MEVNTQPIERISRSSHLDIVKMWQTIQGEGPMIGEPCVFIRLAGCTLMCPFCDTDYTSTRGRMSVGDLVERVRAIRPSGLVVLTGGEPFRQNLGPAIRALNRNGFLVQIETNGTLFLSDLPYGKPSKLIIVCSPKTPKINQDLEQHLDAYKYIVESGAVDREDGLPTCTLGGKRPSRPRYSLTDCAQIYIQPMDEQDTKRNKLHVTAALKSCYEYGYRLCLQTQKFIGLA